jgi:hypothetical protein
VCVSEKLGRAGNRCGFGRDGNGILGVDVPEIVIDVNVPEIAIDVNVTEIVSHGSGRDGNCRGWTWECRT